MALMVASFFIANTSFADVGVDVGEDSAKMMKMIDGLKSELGKMQQANAQMMNEVKDLRGKVAQVPAPVAPQVPKELENQIKALQNEIAALKSQKQAPVAVPAVATSGVEVPAWLNGTHFGGDMLVRFQADSHSGKGEYDRLRGRFRLRYGISKQLNDELKAGFVMATGDANGNRRSSNVTMGNSTAGENGFDKYDLWLDQAYLEYKPYFLQNDNFSTTLHGGKFKENWQHKGFLIHPEAVGFDGFGQSFVFKATDEISLDLNLAQLFISEGAGVDADSEMYVFDSGLKGAHEAFTWGLRGTSYLFAGYNDGGSAALGGSGDYRTLVGTADLGFSIADLPVAMFAQLGKNFNDETIAGQSPGADKFWSMGIALNKLKNPGDWDLGYKFAYLESNVMPTGLPDSDLPAGSEAHWFYANYRLFASTDLNATLIMPRTIAGDGETDSLLAKFNITTRF